MLACTAAGSVELMDGTPPDEVISTPLFAVAKPPITLAELEYSNWFTVVVAGYVAVDHEGVVLEPDKMIWLAVAVPERIANALAVE